jgi:hypothetical protein
LQPKEPLSPNGSNTTDLRRDPNQEPSPMSTMTSSKISAAQPASLEGELESELMELDTTGCNELFITYPFSYLDETDKDVESRLDIIHDVYKALTTREVQFEWRQDHTYYELKTKKKAAQS